MNADDADQISDPRHPRSSAAYIILAITHFK